VNADGSAGAASILITGINAPDGIAIDRSGNIWICANQEDEIVCRLPSLSLSIRSGGISFTPTTKIYEKTPAPLANKQKGRHSGNAAAEMFRKKISA
jgi:hypothetical protein